MPVLRAGSASVTTGAAASTLNFTVPSGAQVGDTILIHAACGFASITWTVTTGPAFTAQTAASGTSGAMQFFSRIMDGTEGWTPGTSTVTLTISTKHAWSGSICAVGPSTFDPALSGSGQVNAASTTITVPGVTTTKPNDLLVWFGIGQAASGQSVGTVTVPTGFTAQTTQANSTGSSTANVGAIMGTATFVTPGATGNENGTYSLAQVNMGLLVSLADNPLQTIITPPVLQPLRSPAPPPQIIPVLATGGPQSIGLTDAGVGTDTLSVVITSNMPLVITGLPTLPVPFRPQQPQIITGPLIAPVLTDAGVGTDTLSVTVTSNMPIVLPVPPSIAFTSPAQPPRVIAPVSPYVIALADGGTATDALAVSVTNMPVVVLPPLLVPFASPAAPPQVIPALVSATQGISLTDSGTGTDTLAATVTSNMPLQVPVPPSQPFTSPAQKPQVIAPVSPYVITLADAGTATDTLAVTVTNIPLVLTAPVLTPLSSPAGPPQVLLGPVSSVQSIPLGDAGTATDTLAVTVTSNMPLVITGLPTLPVPYRSQQPQVIAPVSPYSITLADSGTATDTLSVTVTSNVPLVLSAPVLKPLSSPAGPAQVITGAAPIAVSLTDLGTAADALAVQILVGLADSGTAADSLTLTVTQAAFGKAQSAVMIVPTAQQPSAAPVAYAQSAPVIGGQATQGSASAAAAQQAAATVAYAQGG